MPIRRITCFLFWKTLSASWRGRRWVCSGADSGFYGEEIFRYLGKSGKGGPISYVIAARLYPPVQREISRQKVWLKLGAGIEVGEAQYLGQTVQRLAGRLWSGS